LKIFLGNSPWYPLDKNLNDTKVWGVRAGSRWPQYQPYIKSKKHSLYIPFPHYLSISASMLENNAFDVLLIDAVAEGMSRETYYKKINEYRPDIIFLEVSTTSINYDIEIIKHINSQNPTSKIIVGGPHYLMYKPEFLKNFPEIDIVIMREYEVTLIDVIKKINNNESLKNCAGIIYREKNNIIQNKERYLSDIDNFPLPAYHHLPMKEYWSNCCGLPEPHYNIWASRGCPFNCIFCLLPQLMYTDPSCKKNIIRRYSIERILKELDYVVDKFNYNSIWFDDDTGNSDRHHLINMCKSFKERGWDKNLNWAMLCRADLMDQELLEIMKNSGCKALQYGIETSNQEINNAIGKNLNIKKAKEIIKITKNLGIKIQLSITFGGPGETQRTIQDTINFVREMEPYAVQFSVMTPFPGTAAYKMYKEKGWLLSDDWDNYDGTTISVIKTDNLTAQELERAVIKGYNTWRK